MPNPHSKPVDPSSLEALRESLQPSNLAKTLLGYAIMVNSGLEEETQPPAPRKGQLQAQAWSQGIYAPGDHHKYLAQHLEAVERGEIRRLMVTMPPQHGKSTLASQYFPSWFLGRNPRKRVMLLGHSQNLVEGFGEKIRSHIQSPNYGLLFPGVTLSPTTKAKGNFQVCIGGSPAGEFNAFGVGGGATGRGGELIIIDDLIKNREQADSPTYQEKLREWVRSVALTRQGKDAAIVMVMTRWSVKDIAAWMLTELAHENWVNVTLPAIAEPTEEKPDPVGRAPGAALWPERYSTKQLLQTKATMGEADWLSLYQQNPGADASVVFTPAQFKIYAGAPPVLPEDLALSVQSWDLSFGANNATSSWVVGQVWCPVRNQAIIGGWVYYLLYQYRAQLGFTDTRDAIREVSKLYPRSKVLIENKANGPGVIDALTEMRLDNPIQAIEPGSSSKADRAYQVLPLVERGAVWLPDPEAEPGVKPLWRELESFPQGITDDCVDAMTQALNYLKARLKITMGISVANGYDTQQRKNLHGRLASYSPGANMVTWSGF